MAASGGCAPDDGTVLLVSAGDVAVPPVVPTDTELTLDLDFLATSSLTARADVDFAPTDDVSCPS